LPKSSSIRRSYVYGLSSISKSQVSKLCKDIDERVNAFLDRPLDNPTRNELVPDGGGPGLDVDQIPDAALGSTVRSRAPIPSPMPPNRF
jgi:hypothetical protein